MRLLLVLAAILALGAGLRLRDYFDPLQQDELGPLYAVVYRPGTQPGFTPPADAPLLPVPSWQEVRERSVLPYGIQHPFPLYHYVLSVFMHVLPINEQTLRLPSFLAGLGVIVAVYGLVRQFAGRETAYMAALLTAVEPMQIATSVMARPYALATLVCVLSFLLLWTLLTSKRWWVGGLAAAAHGISVALIGYLNPILLLVGVAQLALVIYWAIVTWKHQKGFPKILTQGMWLMVAGLVGGLLLLPLQAYVSQVQEFNREHVEYLSYFGPPRMAFFVLHNRTLLVALLVSLVIGAAFSFICRKLQAAARVSEPVGQVSAWYSTPNALLWLGLFWLILPVSTAIVLSEGENRTMFMSRYFSYTPISGIIVLAYVFTQVEMTAKRWVMVSAAGAVFGGFSFVPYGYGVQLDTSNHFAKGIKEWQRLEAAGHVRPGDVLVVRSGFLEADFYPGRFSQESLIHLQAVSAAPVLTLYPGQSTWPYIVIPLSHRYGVQFAANALYNPNVYRNPNLGLCLKQYRRYWILDAAAGMDPFPKVFLPRLANLVESDLRVYRSPTADRWDFEIPADIKPGDVVPGLHSPSVKEFGPLLLVERKPESRPNAR